MIHEIQLTIECFRDLIGATLHTRYPCVPNDLNSGTEIWHIDHIEYGEVDLRRVEEPGLVRLNDLDETNETPEVVPSDIEVTGPGLQLMLDLNVHVVSRGALETSNSEPAQTQAIPARLACDIGLRIHRNGRAILHVSFAEILDLDVPEDLKRDVTNLLMTNFNHRIPVHMGRLSGSSGLFVNGGLSASPKLNRVALRLDTDGAENTASQWDLFYRGLFPNYLDGHDWMVLVPKESMLEQLTRRLTEILNAEPRFTLLSEVTAFWPGEIFVQFQGEVVDGCFDIDVDVDVDLKITLSVTTTNAIRTWVSLRWDLNELEVLPCELVAGLIGGILGLVLGPLGGIVGGLGGFIGSIGYASTDAPASALGIPVDWVRVSNTEFYQDTTFPESIGPLSGLSLKGIRTSLESLIYVGDMDINAPTTPCLSIGDIDGFEFTLDDPCQSRTVRSAQALIRIGGVPTCRVSILEDPFRQFVIAYRSTQWEDIRINVTGGGLKPEFKAAPYPCKVLILSQGGARIITLDPPEDIEIDDSLEAENKYMLWKATNCWQAMSVLVRISALEVLWLPYPPESELAIRYWAVAISGLAVGDYVSMNTIEGKEIVMARANEQGQVVVNAMLRSSDPVMLVLNGARITHDEYLRQAKRVPVPKAKPGIELKIRQIYLMERSIMPVDRNTEAIWFQVSNGFPLLNVKGPYGVTRYDVRDIRKPRKAGAVSLVNLPEAENPAQMVMNQTFGRTLDLILASRYDVNPDDVLRWALVRELLVLETPKGLLVIDGSADKKAPRAVLTTGPLCRLAPVSPSHQTIYLETINGRGEIYDLANPDLPKLVSRHTQRPWHVGSTRLGRYIGMLNQENDAVGLYEIVSKPKSSGKHTLK